MEYSNFNGVKTSGFVDSIRVLDAEINGAVIPIIEFVIIIDTPKCRANRYVRKRMFMEPRVLSGDFKKHFAKKVKVSVSGVNVPLFYESINNKQVQNGVILKVEKLSIEFKGDKPITLKRRPG